MHLGVPGVVVGMGMQAAVCSQKDLESSWERAQLVHVAHIALAQPQREGLQWKVNQNRAVALRFLGKD